MIAIICFIVVSVITFLITAISHGSRFAFPNEEDKSDITTRKVVCLICIVFGLLLIIFDRKLDEEIELFKCVVCLMAFHGVLNLDLFAEIIFAILKYMFLPLKLPKVIHELIAKKREEIQSSTYKKYEEVISKARALGLEITPNQEVMMKKAITNHLFAQKNDPVSNLVSRVCELIEAYEDLPTKEDFHSEQVIEALKKLSELALKCEKEMANEAEKAFFLLEKKRYKE